MSTSDLTKFPGGTQDKGLNIFEPDIGAEITWDEDTINVSSGTFRGTGPRYGVAPLAGHSNTETPAGNETNGIQRSEITSGAVGLTHRELIYGIVPITMAPYDGAYPKDNKQFYVYLVGLDDSSNVTLDACIGATLASSVNKQSSSIVSGLAQSSYRQESPLARRHKTEFINLPTDATPTAADMQTILRVVSGRYWMPYAHISLSGKRVAYNWMVGNVTGGTAGATTAPSFNLWQSGVTSGLSPSILGGAPSEIQTREASDNDQRLLLVYCLDINGYFIDIQYKISINNGKTAAVAPYAGNATGSHYQSLSGATKSGVSTAYSSINTVIVNDPGSFTNTRHDAILAVAGEKALAVIYQDWLPATKGMMPRWVDLTLIGCAPRQGVGTYSDDGFNTVSSAFINFSQVELTTETDPVGILQPGIRYDIGFSYYNKLIDFETNVVYGSSVTPPGTIGTDPAQALCVCSLAASTENVFEQMQAIGYTSITVPFDYADSATVSGGSTAYTPRGKEVNDYEIRFYYKETGAAEWLPAGSFDAAKYWFFTQWNQIGSIVGPFICQGATAGLPGGQSNGFVDYSPLPKQRYICTTVFQNRAFWWGEKSMHFSLTNNIYAYPKRNIVATPTGKWRGGIVHIRNNVAQQASRLVVFGDTTFSARFTGEKTLANVRISSETVGQFELDGSDFRMDYLCDSTAFSFRSAVVADGILYWWGPQGIYRDDGIADQPKKISGIIEPDIFSYIDMARDTEVHCVYNKRTSEILWFYPPKTADSSFPTHGLIYNTANGNFYPFKMRCQVDASQNIKLENDSTPDDVDGERILIHCRETTASTVQRTFYFDDLVAAGEQGPARELTVLTVATPVAGTRRLTLAAGSVGITAGSIAVNDLISIQNAKGYAPALTAADNLIAKITAINNGSNYIEILLPDGANFDAAASLTGQTAFPIYQKKPAAAGLHGITFKLQTNYWLPDGVSNSWFWQYLYFIFKYTGIPTPNNPLTGLPTGAEVDLIYRSLVCRAELTDSLRLRDNSAGHCQIHHPMRNEGRAASGQALKYALSGIYIGNPWTLEYLEAHCLKERGFTLKEFEG